MASLSAKTSLPFEQFKAKLDQSMDRSFAAHALTRLWLGRTLEITGPGCRASATFEDGQFRGPIELVGAARLMRRRIYADMNRMLRDAGCVEIRVK